MYTYGLRTISPFSSHYKGYTFAYTYDGNGNIITEVDGNGNVVTYTYDGLDRIVGKVDGEGGSATKVYDPDGRLISAADAEGAVTTYTYDANSRVTAMTDALGFVTSFTYDEMDRVLTKTDPNGGVTTYTYTDRGEVETITDAEDYVTSYVYDGNGNCVQMTTPDGITTYTYDPLDRLISTVTPDGKSEILEYDGLGRVTASTDKGGHKTQYVYDSKGNVVETIDATGHSSFYSYDSLGNLLSTTLRRIDTQDNVDQLQVTMYEYDGRNLVTKEINAAGKVTQYQYDGNGNLLKKIDADGYQTMYTYNGLDLVTHINYNGGKQVDYQYNATGELVEMEDWTGTNTFELDLLNRITEATDHRGNVTEYTYDGNGNQTSIVYPDNSVVEYTYDLVNNLASVTEDNGNVTTYEYDGMGRQTKMYYPNGWVEHKTYDSIGQLIEARDVHPSEQSNKSPLFIYEYDDCGNMIYEYKRGNGNGQSTVEVFYTYDALHRITKARETYGSATRNYQYDSLGNLTYESNSNNEKWDYKINILNQIVEKGDTKKDTYYYTYDNRGNLVQTIYEKNKKQSLDGSYVYDETNRMVRGGNVDGEASFYVYNGLDVLVENTWSIVKNNYGYKGSNSVNQNTNNSLLGNEVFNVTAKNAVVIVKSFVIDYTSETHDVLMETETNNFSYRYVYGNERLSVWIPGVTNGGGNLVNGNNVIHLYYHQDFLGTVDYLTSAMTSKVASWTHYNEWGEITHNAVLKCGQREFDLVKNYTGHEYDAVLDMYYAKYRFYDANDRRFTAMDPVKGSIIDPMSLVQYLYVSDNPLKYTDPLGRVEVGVGDEAGQMLAATPKTPQVPATLPYGKNPNTDSASAAKEQQARTPVAAPMAHDIDMIGGGAGIAASLPLSGFDAMGATAAANVAEALTAANAMRDFLIGVLGTFSASYHLNSWISTPTVTARASGYHSRFECEDEEAEQEGALQEAGTGNPSPEPSPSPSPSPTPNPTLPTRLPEGIETYENQFGHHILAKKAFEGNPAYDPYSALTINEGTIKAFGTTHQVITGQQHSLYSAFARTGAPFSLAAMRQIELKALLNAGIPYEYAVEAINQAIEQLISWGITEPLQIPWG